MRHDSTKVIRNHLAHNENILNGHPEIFLFVCFIHFQRMTMLPSQIDNYQTPPPPPPQQKHSESGTDYLDFDKQRLIGTTWLLFSSL